MPFDDTKNFYSNGDYTPLQPLPELTKGKQANSQITVVGQDLPRTVTPTSLLLSTLSTNPHVNVHGTTSPLVRGTQVHPQLPLRTRRQVLMIPFSS